MAERAPANKAARTTRRKGIAEGMVNQKSAAVIAAEMGISRATIYNELNHPDTQDYIQRLLAPHDERLSRLVDNSISAVELSLGALRDDAADHGIRMRAVEQTRKLLELRAGRRDDGDSNGKPMRWSGTLEELLVVYRQISTTPAA